MNSKGSKIAIVILVLATVFLLLDRFVINKPDKTCYVSMSLLFEDSKYKSKFETDLKEIENSSNKKLALMQDDLRELKKKNAPQIEIENSEKLILKTQEILTQEYQKKSEIFEQAIWKKINDKIADFAKQEGYDYIFGAKGDGGLMYANESKDVTKQVLKIINE